MTPCKPTFRKLSLLILSFIVFSVTNVSAQDGAALFKSKCGSCHVMGMDMTGPDLVGVIDRWGGNREHLHLWINNYTKAIAAGIPRAIEAQKLKSSEMQIFEGSITATEIDAILDYIGGWEPAKKDDPKIAEGETSNNNAIIFGVISLILAIIALILMQVNSNLKKLSDDAEGIHRPEPVPFFQK